MVQIFRSGGVLSFLILVLFTSCRSPQLVAEEEPPLPDQLFYTIEGSAEPEGPIEQQLRPWRTLYDRAMDRPVAVAEADFAYGRPESPLGNLVADLLRNRASLEMERLVHFSVIPHGRIRTTLPEGTIRLGDLYELYPENERLVVLELTGEDVFQLADEIAARGGMPVSGLRMTLQEGKATGVLLHTGTPSHEETYLLATVSGAVESGQFLSLEPNSITEFHVSVRDLLVRSLASRGHVTPYLDLRIRTSATP